MEAFRKLLRAAPQEHAINPSDDIYPLTAFDQIKPYQMVLGWSMRFNDVLDAAKLGSSLSELLEMGDWRKLGGRLRRNKEGRLEMHVPRPFTTERPAIMFTHNALDVGIEEHPLAKTFPKMTDGPSLQKGHDQFREFNAPPNAPATINDYCSRDISQLSLHVTSFTDATIVAVLFPHTLMDAMGFKHLLKAWSLVLAGRESEVPPMLGSREDVTAPIVQLEVKEVEEEYALHPKRLQDLRMLLFVFNFLWDLIWNPTIVYRTIFLPREVVNRMYQRAKEEIAASAQFGNEKPFISEGDVLSAWATNCIASSERAERPVTILSALNLRFWAPALAETEGVYVQNLAAGTMAFLSPSEARGPLGLIALSHRRHLIEQTRPPQIRALMRLLRERPDDTLVFGEPNMRLVVFSNWTKAKFMTTVDFSAAVVRQGECQETRKNPLGTMVFHNSEAMTTNITQRNVVKILGKDHEGNYWLEGMLLAKSWAKIEESLRTL